MIVTLPIGARGFDTASSLSPVVLDRAQEAGYSFVIKYVPYGAKRSAKMWTAQEIEWVQQRGMAVLAVFEVQGDRALGGGSQGIVDGAMARGGMMALRYPDNLFIISAVDYDVWSRNDDQTIDYVKAFAQVCGGGMAVYGDQDVADGLIGHNPIVCLPNARGWSRSLFAAGRSLIAQLQAARQIPGVCIFQYPSLVDPQLGLHIDPLVVVQPVHAWALDAPTPPTPKPPTPPLLEDKMATARITVEGRNAQFYGTGTLQPDGNVHCVFITWSGSGDDPNNHFIADHSGARDIVDQHYSPDTLKRDLVLVGNPGEIQDASHAWSADDFFRVS